MSSLSCLELFAGAGGLAKGLDLAGIQPQAFVEWDKNACFTLTQNHGSHLVHQVDVRAFEFSQFRTVDLIAGGPPCQPFSTGGKHRGNIDNRNMFPVACRAIGICTPKAFIFENVKGLLRQSFRHYFEYILLQLKYPTILPKASESWEAHFIRLQKNDASGIHDAIKYNVVYKLVNAANYGIPQRRERVFIIGIREDLDIEWSFPKESHSFDALLWSQFITGEYWGRHGISPSNVEEFDKKTQQRVQKLLQQPRLFPPLLQPWKTVRDQVGALPKPDAEGHFDVEHILREGARVYPGHTGSYIDLPSKALKAGDHGVPGGENMIRYRDGRVRYYTTFEAKRIQTFPNSYRIHGSWTEAMRQLGNAVPVELAYCVACSLSEAIIGRADHAIAPVPNPAPIENPSG